MDLQRRTLPLSAGILAGVAPLAGAPRASAEPLAPADLDLLRRTFALADEARADGSAPYGALIADAGGNVVVEKGNTSGLPGGNPTQHAELVSAADAYGVLGYEGMNAATLYASTEPCTMCSGAAYWAGIGRVVYGMSAARLFQFTGDNPARAGFALPCRDILQNGTRPVTVSGPLLEDEAAQSHRGYWHR